jgi:hypothetical protein
MRLHQSWGRKKAKRKYLIGYLGKNPERKIASAMKSRFDSRCTKDDHRVAT